MKTTILVYDHLCRQQPNQETYLPEQLIKAYESIGYTAFPSPLQPIAELPEHLKEQAL